MNSAIIKLFSLLFFHKNSGCHWTAITNFLFGILIAVFCLLYTSISIYSLENKKLVIEDTGIGISKEDIPRIFDKGFTGYNGRTDKKATGLGLYLCKNILDKLSHKISIESEVGVKTKVILDLAMVNVNIE